MLFFYQDKKEESIELLHYGIEAYPYTGVLCGSLAELYLDDGQKNKAIEYFQMALKRSSQNLEDYLKYKVLLESVKQ